MCRSKISIHIDVRYKKSYTVKKVPEVAAGMKNKILVIEDDRAISELLCMNLEAAGYETDVYKRQTEELPDGNIYVEELYEIDQ